MNDRRIPTTPEVWAVIRARHHKGLVVFGSVTDVEGGIRDGGLLATSYGFPGAEIPLISARTTWDIVRHDSGATTRENETTEYWLHYAVEDDHAHR